MSDPCPEEKGTPYIGVNPHLDPQVVERVGTVLVQSFMLLLPVVLNWTLQRFLKKAVDPVLVPMTPKANVTTSDDLSSHLPKTPVVSKGVSPPAKEALRDE